MIYRWDENAWFKSNPNDVGNELEHINDQYGSITPELVVNHARNTSSALHSDFEWDDVIAATEHRKQTARKIIRSLRVVSEDGVVSETPVFVNVKEGDRNFYEKTITAIENPDHWIIVMNDTRKSLNALNNRLNALKTLEVDTLRMKLTQDVISTVSLAQDQVTEAVNV